VEKRPDNPPAGGAPSNGFFGVLIEHYAGAFPPWLSPEQIKIIPVGETFFDYAKELERRLRKEGLRVSADLGDDRMNAKIRNAQQQKIPYMVIIGDREAQNDQVSVRLRTGKQENGLSTQAFIDMVKQKVENKEQL
jgi:threonyl-tRNA synthetase